MDSTEVMLRMMGKPRKLNRADREFVASVDLERRKNAGALETTVLGMKSFFLFTVIRGVYIDADLGNYDITVYLANSVAYKGVEKPAIGNPCAWEGVVESPDKLREICEGALFIAGFAPNMWKSDGLGKDFFLWVGSKGYDAMRNFARDNVEFRAYLALSRNFNDYASALEHTASEYFGRKPA